MSIESDVAQLKAEVAVLKEQFVNINADKKTVDQLALATSINSGDLIQIGQGSEIKKYPAENVISLKWVTIGDAFVGKKSGYATLGTIEVGDIIMRSPSTGRFIIAEVDALPHTTDANLSFFLDTSPI